MFKIPLWFWKKSVDELIVSQLKYFNKDKEEEEQFKKSDFKIVNKIEE